MKTKHKSKTKMRVIVKHNKHKAPTHQIRIIQQLYRQLMVCRTCCNILDCPTYKLLSEGKKYNTKYCKYKPVPSDVADLPIIVYSCCDMNNIQSFKENKYKNICKARLNKSDIIKKEPKTGQ